MALANAKANEEAAAAAQAEAKAAAAKAEAEADAAALLRKLEALQTPRGQRSMTELAYRRPRARSAASSRSEASLRQFGGAIAALRLRAMSGGWRCFPRRFWSVA